MTKRKAANAKPAVEGGPLPLSGIRVLDLSRDIAGPTCAQHLGDLGADVIKVEHPTRGDEIRLWRPRYRTSSTYYLVANRNKRGINLDLKSQRGRTIVEALVRRSQVVVENFRHGAASSLRLSFDDLKKINPTIVLCSIRGYGAGSRESRPAYDAAIQAFSGIMSVTGQRNGDVARVGVALVDFSTGLYAALGVMAALRQAEETGRGAHVEVSLYDTAIASMAYQLVTYFMTGEVITRGGSSHPAMAPAKVFKTATDEVFILAGNDRHWQLLSRALGRDDWATDERFQANESRVRRRDEVHDMVETVLKTRALTDWAEEFDRLGVPYAPVRTVDQVAGDPDVIQSMIGTIRHSDGQEVQLVRSPMLFDGAHLPITKAPPDQGQDTEEILRELGFTKGDVAAFQADGVV